MDARAAGLVEVESFAHPGGLEFRGERFKSQAHRYTVLDPDAGRFLQLAALLTLAMLSIGTAWANQGTSQVDGWHIISAETASGSIFVVQGGMWVWLMLLALVRRWIIVKESVLVVRNVGIQRTTEYLSGRTESDFIDRAHLRAVILNEGITRFRVIFYLALVVQDAPSMVVLFPHFRPRLPLVEHIYHGIRHVMYQEPETPILSSAEFDEVLKASVAGSKGQQPWRIQQ